MYQLGPVAVYGEHEDDPGGLSVRIASYVSPGAYPWWSESTQAVLEAMTDLPVAGARVLDFGCGASAVLAITAAKMGAKEVIACEIHPEYAAIARRQIEANGLDIPVVAEAKGKFDIAVANIGDAVLAGQVSKLAKHGVATDKEGGIISW